MTGSFGLPSETLASLRDVFKKYDAIEEVVVYGSRAKGNFRDNSDIDLTLVGKKLTLSLLLEVETEIDDLLLPYKVDLSIKDQIDNPNLIEHIERVGQSFYSK